MRKSEWHTESYNFIEINDAVFFFIPGKVPRWYSKVHSKVSFIKIEMKFGHYYAEVAPGQNVLPSELRRSTMSAGLILNPMTGGNNTR